MDNNLISFLQYIFGVVEGAERQNAADSRSCKNCGLTYGAFKAVGKLGCAQCYTAFRENISGALMSIHGSGEYKGRIPSGQGNKYENMLIKRELAESRVLLKKAVEAEEFEEAVKYRDIISDLTKKIGEEA